MTAEAIPKLALRGRTPTRWLGVVAGLSLAVLSWPAIADESPSANATPAANPDESAAGPGNQTQPQTRPGTRARAVGFGLVSAALGLGGLAPVPYYARYGLDLGASVPLLALAPGDGWQVGGLQAGFIAGAFALRRASLTNTQVAPYRTAAEVISLHQALYAAYATYRAGRVSGTSEAWTDSWRPWTAGELIVAPVQPKNLRHPVVYLSLSIEAGVLALGAAGFYATGGHTKGGAAVRQIALGTALSWDAGVTEEALFRGFLYEELKSSLSKWTARAIDMTLFTAAHVPGEIASHQKPSLIVAGLFSRALGGLLNEIAYDEGGLPESVALHVLWDTLAFVAASLSNTEPLSRNILMPHASEGGQANFSPGSAFVPTLTLTF